MKFWQKAYLLTLALFLLALNGGVAVVLSAARRQAWQAQCGVFLAQQHAVAQSFAADAAAVSARRPEQLPRLGQDYARQFKKRGVLLRVSQGDTLWADELPAPDTPLPTVPPAGQRVHAALESGGRHMLYVAAMLPAPPEDVTIICAFDTEEFFAAWAHMERICYLAGAAVSLVLAAALYGVLRGLSRPMERLARTAATLADGDYTARCALSSRDEVGQLADTMNTMAARVEENMEALREEAQKKQVLVDNVAHELRTPLTAVRGYAEYIQRAELSEDERYEATQYIVEEAGRLAAMSERLLQMSALRGEDVQREPIDLPSLVEQAVRTVKPRARQREVAVAAVQLDACTVQGEAVLLESLAVNLIDNAVKACDAGGQVEISLRQGGQGIELLVRDTGRGMDAETLRHIGEPFFRPDKARSRAQGGAGLGLALCRQIAESHGAHLTFTSTPGKGTTACVTFTA